MDISLDAIKARLSKVRRLAVQTSIRRRLFATLLVPILAVAFVSGRAVNEANNRGNQVRHQAALAEATGGPATLITSLMDERNISALELLGLGTAVKLRVPTSAAARKATDASLVSFKNTLDNGDPSVQALYGPVLAKTKTDLAKARNEMDGFGGERNLQNLYADTVYGTYTKLIAGFHAANTRTVDQINDAVLRNRSQSVATQSVSSDLTSQLARSAALTSIQAGGATQADFRDATKTYTEYLNAKDEAVRLLDDDPATQRVVSGFYNRPSQVEMRKLFETYLETGKTDPTTMIKKAADFSSPNAGDAWTATNAAISARANTMVRSSDQERNANIAIFFAAVAAALIAAFLAARSISDPLRELAEQARSMVRQTLPTAIAGVLATPAGTDIVLPEVPPISGSNIREVDDVAEAMNTVQDRSITLAVEQAGARHNLSDSFVNVGRRVQGLVSRQLEHLTEMEDSEQDPDELEHLFKLDHLATRIRRNAESLVVLAGPGKGRIVASSEPTPILDVIRSAVSEVEDYPRIELANIMLVDVLGQAANDAAHMLAELIENALMFSDPQTLVFIAGHEVDNGYMVTITDQGFGMTAEQLEVANRRLAGQESFTVSPSKYLGHYVAGSLAARIGAEAQLSANPSGGVVAAVVIPDRMLSDTVTDTNAVEVVNEDSDNDDEDEDFPSSGPIVPNPPLSALMAANRKITRSWRSGAVDTVQDAKVTSGDRTALMAAKELRRANEEPPLAPR